MKLFLDYKLNDTGKGKFLKRLIPELDKLDVQVRFKPNGCDVALGVVKWNRLPDMPRVLRIDGIHLTKGKKQAWRNEQIRKSIKNSHAAIYQSQFAKKTVKKHLKVSLKREYVIYNGANPKDYEIEPLKLPLSYIYNRLMCARWANRKSKRLMEHLRIVDACPDLHFYLAGEHPPIVPQPNLVDLGRIPDEVLRKYMVSCAKLVYMAHPDWCPNTVVEARMAKMDIIYERGCGVEEVALAPMENLFIWNVAKQYKQVFDDLKKR